MKDRTPLLVFTGLVAMCAFGVYMSRQVISAPKPKVAIEDPGVVAARKDRSGGDSAFATRPEQAKKQYTQFIAKHQADRSPAVQDEVGNVEIRLAYLAARSGDFDSSRKEFLAATKIKGTGAMSADFGGVPDQAAYQAIVCLVAEHKEEEAKQQFRGFMKDRPLSPLVTAAFRRLRRLNNNDVAPADEALLQKDIKLQESHIRFETSVCGPKTIEYLLRKGLFPLAHLARNGGKGSEGKTPLKNERNGSLSDTTQALPDYKIIATLCGTTDSGTSLEGLRKGLKALGIESYGVQLNRKDFANVSLPAILLEGDHYLAVLHIDGDKAVVYDSRYGSESSMPLPAIDDVKFLATVLTFSPPVLTEETN